MNHFKADLMVLSRVVDSKVLRMAIQLKYFLFLIKRQNGECTVINLGGFLWNDIQNPRYYKRL